MKSWLTRFWRGLFALPDVSPVEALVYRALMAMAVFWFFPAAVQHTAQPEPVGLAHWTDLTWLHGDGVMPVYRTVFLAALLLFVAGVQLPAVLPLVTLLHILPPTLHNSQGFTFHGNQILSLTLLGMSAAAVSLAVMGRANVLRSLSLPQFVVLLAVVLLEAFLGCWFIERLHQAAIGSLFTVASMKLGWVVAPAAQGWVNWAVFIVVFAALCVIPCGLVRSWREDRSPGAAADAWSLLSAQFTIAAAYLISVFSKFIRSDGEWLMNSHYVALDFVKTMRQNFHSSLDPQFAGDPPGYILTMLENPVLTAVFFDIGVALEAFMILAVGSRLGTFAFGISLIIMHYVIAQVMNLFFPTHIAMLAIFWALPFVWSKAVGAKENSLAANDRGGSAR